MGIIQNNAAYNFQGDITSVMVIGMNMTDNTIGFYRAIVPVQEPISNLLKDRLFGRKRGRTVIYDTSGEVADITTQDVETLIGQESTMTIMENELFEVDKGVIDGYRNVLEAMILGEKFFITAGGDEVKVLGTAGNVRLEGFPMKRGKDWKNFFYQDNLSIKAYGGDKTRNPFLGSSAKTNIHVVLESKQQSNADTDQVLKYSGICFYNNGLTEAPEKNDNEFAFMYDSDLRIYNQFYVEGFSTEDANGLTDTTLYAVNADYIIHGSGLDLASLTDFGTSGEVACVIDTDTGAVEIGSTNGTDTWTAATGATVQGTIIHGTKVGTGTTVAGATDEYAIVSIKTGGATGTGTAVGTTVTSTVTWAVGTTYHAPVFSFDMSAQEFTQVNTEADL